MFDLSLVEILFIAVVALVVIGPQDLPKVLRAVMRTFRQFQEAYSDIRSQVDDLVEESGIRESRKDIQTIIDQHGEIQQVYDLSDFLDEDGNYITQSSNKPERQLPTLSDDSEPEEASGDVSEKPAKSPRKRTTQSIDSNRVSGCASAQSEPEEASGDLSGKIPKDETK